MRQLSSCQNRKMVIVGSQAWFLFSLVSHLSYHEAVELSGIGSNNFLLGNSRMCIATSYWSTGSFIILLEDSGLRKRIALLRAIVPLVEPAKPKQYPMGVYQDFLSVCVAYSILLGSLVVGTSTLMLRSAQLLTLVLY